MVIACGYLNADGTRCNQPAVAAVQVSPEVSVPACADHAVGTVYVFEAD